ncbi:DHA2 family efflux MFS transporter permease subunit [Microlunatus panaciterrae]|uniref:EmrB/QacA subfamily drug resistance transporter n=1 Tax=Microlunatus panaciterrae TaxID=400768 RepID=A0ABS2RJV6_9ACTN|nr:DHA2 family efflux MFS transporter permease subunit [Microlunatus panaciterrae]MBM7798772.1 EmrB/QacA subfamily drug resistance transporter [Microlunatus panaciterrae]
MSSGAAVTATGSRRWVGLFFISLGVALIIVDSTIVNVAIPSIISDLGIDSTQAQWVQEIYTLIFASLLLMWGRLADQWGRRRLFVIGVLVFMVASLLAARSADGNLLILARALQGVGGAMMLPTSLSLLNAGFRGRDRGIAFGIWGATIGGTAALGPLLGGWLTTSFSWRWAFGINLPLGVAVVIGLLLLVPESKDDDADRGLDWIGALLSAVGFGGVVFGLIEGRNLGWWRAKDDLSFFGAGWPWRISPVVVAFVLGVAALAVFVAFERGRNRRHRVAMLDLSLFGIRSFRNGNIAAAIVSLGEFGIIFALPLWFQNVAGYSAFQTGLALLPLAAGSFVASGLGAALGQRRGAIFVVRVGILLELVGVAGLGIFIRPDSTWLTTSPLLFVYGIGVGFATAQLTGVVLADVPLARSGQGSGTQSTARQVGSALGIAILGTVLFASLGSRLDDTLTGFAQLGAEQRTALVAAVKDSAGSIIPSLNADPRTAPIGAAAETAFSDATRYSALTAAAFLLIGLLASRSLGSGRAKSIKGEASPDGYGVGAISRSEE